MLNSIETLQIELDEHSWYAANISIVSTVYMLRV